MKKLFKKLFPYLAIPFIVIGIELLLYKDAHNGIYTKFAKLLNSNTKYNICFYGDSKSFWNYNYNELSNQFSDLSFYNYALGGFSYDDLINFYGDNLCNCDLNIINLHELTQDKNRIKSKNGYLFSNLKSLSFLNPMETKRVINKIIQDHKNEETIINGFHNIINKSKTHPDLNDFDDEIDLIKLEIKKKYKRFSEAIEGKNVIFVIHPDRNFRKNYLINRFGNDFLISLHEKFFKEHSLINFRDIPLLSVDSLYYDSHHLNKFGAVKFSKIFSDSLRQNTIFNKIDFN